MERGGAASFGELLKRHRIASGLSQESLAERAGVSASAISALERGARRAPYRDNVILLADALGLSPSERGVFDAAAERARGRQPRAPVDEDPLHNLPARTTSFIGRESEIAELRTLLASSRLVTVTGSGGVGKTRTAVELGRQLFYDRQEEIWFVDLSPIVNGTFVASAIAAVLRVSLAQAADAAPSLAAGLRTRKALIILDNCEHVIGGAAAATSAILRKCPGITIVATSRERLAIEGERVYRLPSLAVPTLNTETLGNGCSFASFQLFMQRARAVDSHLALTADSSITVAEICRQLEGIPLAIELAATRLPGLGFRALRKQLKQHFQISTPSRDLPQRQKTMLATIAWSYDLLDDQERALLRRLAVFNGGATLSAIEEVCGGNGLITSMIPELLSLLIDKSLLTITIVNEQSRYAMLESVRAFASDKLTEADEAPQMAKAHLEWLAILAEHGEEQYAHGSFTRWHRDFGAEIDNVRAGLEWSLRSGIDPDGVLAGQIIGGLRGLWISMERRGECRRWAEVALQRLDVDRHPRIGARLLRAQAQSCFGSAVIASAERAIPLFELIGERRAVISLHANNAWEYSLMGAFEQAEVSTGRAFAIAVEERAEHSRQFMHLLQIRCAVRARSGRLDDARSDFAEASRMRRILGEQDAKTELYWEAFFAFSEGDFSRSAELFEASAKHALEESISPAEALCELAAVRLLLNDLDAAELAAKEALRLARFEHLIGWRAIGHLAGIAAVRGHPVIAARLIGFVNAWCERNDLVRGATDRGSYSVLMSSLREQLTEGEIESFSSDGMLLDVERAIDESLGLSANEIYRRQDHGDARLRTYPMPLGRWCEAT